MGQQVQVRRLSIHPGCERRWRLSRSCMFTAVFRRTWWYESDPLRQ